MITEVLGIMVLVGVVCVVLLIGSVIEVIIRKMFGSEE